MKQMDCVYRCKQMDESYFVHYRYKTYFSPVESDTYSNTFNSHVSNMANFFGVKPKGTLHRAQCSKLSTDCSSIETSKSASDQSIEYENYKYIIQSFVNLLFYSSTLRIATSIMLAYF